MSYTGPMELPGVPCDTHREARRRQIEGLRAMTPAERLERTLALCASADELAFAGMRLREGHLSLPEMRRRLAITRYGPELIRRVEAYRALRDGGH